MVDVVGTLGSILLAFCSLPQVYTCYKTKKADGVSAQFITMWWLGLIFTATYVFLKHGIDSYLHSIYLLNFISCSIILGYKVKGGKMVVLLKNTIYSLVGIYPHKRYHFKDTKGRNGYVKIEFSEVWLGIPPLCGYARWINSEGPISELKLVVESANGLFVAEKDSDFCYIEKIKPWEPLTDV